MPAPANCDSALLAAAARTLAAAAPALLQLEDPGPQHAAAAAGIERGYFASAEDDVLKDWYARYLTARAALLEVINDLRPLAVSPDPERGLEGFVMAYTAASVLVRAARYLVSEFGRDPVVRRKLDEADPIRRIPRKQYTAIYDSLTSPRHAWRLAWAIRFADEHRQAMVALAADPCWAAVLEWLERSEPALRVDFERYIGARLRYRGHSWRRRHRSAAQQSMFAVLEAFGRVIAEVRAPGHRSSVRSATRRRLEAVLQPGDVLITRHEGALSNLFLPGYWPHAALYIGDATTKLQLPPAEGDDEHRRRWIKPLRVLEARKDGVLFRALSDTLAVDAVVALRPGLPEQQILDGIARAVAHEGKLYNFDFDFFRSDRLVCTEVIYRAYDGLGPIQLPLTSRAGRITLSAEDLIDHALDGKHFEPVALFGTPATGRKLIVGPAAREALQRTRELAK